MFFYKLFLILSWIALCTLHIMHSPFFWGIFFNAVATTLFYGIWLQHGEAAFKKKLPWFSLYSLLIPIFLIIWPLSFWDGRYAHIINCLGISEIINQTTPQYIPFLLVLFATPALLFIAFNIGEVATTFKHRLISLLKQQGIDIFKIRFSHSSQFILAAALLFLILPNICFLLGWVQWYLALPVILCICIGAYIIITRTPHRIISYNYANIFSLIIGFLLCTLLAECMGFMGQVAQSWDLIYRNAFYHTLVSEPWPIFSSRNEYFVYYHAFWLPPALCCKIIGESVNSLFILTLWSFYGLFTIFLILYSRIKGRAVGLFILILTIGSLYNVEWINHLVLSGSGQIYAYFIPIWTACIRDTFHAGIPALVVMCLGYSKLSTPFSYYFIAALMLATSPLQAIVLLPLLVYWTWPCIKNLHALKKLICGITWLAIPLVVCVAIYLSRCNESAGFRWIFENSEHNPAPIADSYSRMLFYVNTVLIILVPFILVLRRKLLHSPYAILVTILAFILPFCWIGRWVNEFIFKGSVVILFLMAVSYGFIWIRSKAHTRCLLMLLFIASSYYTIRDINSRIIKTYSRNPVQMQQNISDDWEQHINHPDDPNYCHFFGTSPPASIFYVEKGASPIRF